MRRWPQRNVSNRFLLRRTRHRDSKLSLKTSSYRKIFAISIGSDLSAGWGGNEERVPESIQTRLPAEFQIRTFCEINRDFFWILNVRINVIPILNYDWLKAFFQGGASGSAAKPYSTLQSGAAVVLTAGSDSGGAYAPLGPNLLLRYQLQPNEGWFLLGGKVS